MITYVDTSTLLKLIIDEDGSDRAAMIWTSADPVASVSLVLVEARAAIAAATRGRRVTTALGRAPVDLDNHDSSDVVRAELRLALPSAHDIISRAIAHPCGVSRDGKA